MYKINDNFPWSNYNIDGTLNGESSWRWLQVLKFWHPHSRILAWCWSHSQYFWEITVCDPCQSRALKTCWRWWFYLLLEGNVGGQILGCKWFDQKKIKSIFLYFSFDQICRKNNQSYRISLIFLWKILMLHHRALNLKELQTTAQWYLSFSVLRSRVGILLFQRKKWANSCYKAWML